MEGEILKICAVALLCAVAGAIVGRMAGGMSAAVRIAGLALAFGGVIGLIGTAVDMIEAFGIDGSTAEYTSLMLRGLGIAVLCRLCSDICRECGETVMAGAVESAGKISMIIIALPVAYDAVSTAEELIDML